ncbi:MAG: hypothetical protein ABI231_08715 [Candidatus Tumulicola sp.]
MLSNNDAKRENVKAGPLPLVVGVMGHRDLVADEVPDIVRRVRDLFIRLRNTYPHTPLILMSSLAEGADRLVARAALDFGAELYVVLPLPLHVYEQDFSSEPSLQEFRQLMQRSYAATVVAMADDRDAQAARVSGPARDRRYAAAGAFLVSYSQILIALWDGEPAEMLGGTSQMVRFALQGVPSKYLSGSADQLRTNETGAVYHVLVGRQSAKAADVSFPLTGWMYPGAERGEAAVARHARAAFEQNLRCLEQFNGDAAAAKVRLQASRSAERLLSSEQEASLHHNPVVLEYTRAMFGQADALALSCRNWTHAAMIAIFTAIGIATVLFSFYTNVLSNEPALYVGFLGVVAVAFGVDIAVKRQRLQDRFQDYRALAEGLRVQYFWRLAGIRESVYDHYLARQEGELDWIRNAMRAAQLRRQTEPDAPTASVETPGLLEIVLNRWVNDQEAYFSRAAQVERDMATRIRWAANACLVVTGAVAITLAATLAERAHGYHEMLVMLLTLALAAAGLFAGYAQKRAHDEHARRYQRMCALYRIAGERVASLLREDDPSGAKAVFVQLGREALAETCDWLLLHRERQIDVPTA